MKNPIEGNIFTWGNIKFIIADDFSKVVIEEDGNKVAIPTSALTDLKYVMSKEMENKSVDDELQSLRLYNSLGTTRSFPTAKWSDL